MSNQPTLAPDAAMVLGIAATAIPFARTPEEEVERWLRVLRLHGDVGGVLQSLGVSEDAIDDDEGSRANRASGADSERAHGGGSGGERRDVIALVGESAGRIAASRGSAGVATTDLLMALLQVYGPVFERALRAHGTDSDEVLERLAA
ncbi:MAG TPA: hypothetical protein VN672_05040 [Solirubrobacteraceae bacterium]|nr:hypothetical protein [Solirubrobacteraceae bacterium]